MVNQLSLSHLRKSFGDVDIIHDISLQVEEGEFVVFVGPSGCGKSTLLRMIAGLEDVSGGEIIIGGQPVHDVPPVKRGIAMVFQSYALYPHMSVFENIAFPLRVEGLPNAEIKKKVDEAAHILKLSDRLYQKPGTLSGGQRQRVAIGRAIVRKPKIFLFDEPLSNLDAALRADMRIELLRLHKSLGSTIIYVTHDQVEAMTMASKIVVLKNGRIEQIGTPLDLYNHPCNQFVAGFIGSPKMNFLKGTCQSVAAKHTTIHIPQLGDIKLRTCNRPDLVGKPVVIGIRPEHVSAGKGEISFDLQPQIIERLGHETITYNPLQDATNFIAVFDGRVKINENEPVSVSVKAENCHLFDDAGQSLSSN